MKKPIFAPLTNDIIFKAVFAHENSTRILACLINALLNLEGEKKLTVLTIKNPFIIPETYDGKQSILDLQAQDQSGKIYCIELQMRKEFELIKRVIYYSTRTFVNQAKDGESYSKLNKTISLWIMGEKILEEPEIYNCYLLKHRENNNVLTDILEYHFVELPKFKKDKPKHLQTRFEKWLHLLKFSDLYKGIDELPEELKEEEGIAEVIERMNNANADPRLQDVLHKKILFEHDQATRLEDALNEGMMKGIMKGKIEGEIEGQKKLVLRMLERGRTRNEISELTGLTIEEINSFLH